MTRDELVLLLGGGRREILKTLKQHDRFLASDIVREVERCLQDIADNSGTLRIRTWPPETKRELYAWSRRSDRNKIYVNGQPAYWVELRHDNASIYEHFEPVAWIDLQPGEEVWIDNVAANPRAAVPVTGPWIVVHYHKLFSIKNNSTITYQVDNIVRKK